MLGTLLALAFVALSPFVTPGRAGHVSDIDRGLFSQGLLPGSTGLDAPLGDRAPAISDRAGAAATASAGGSKPALRVYVVVVDGLRPQEVGALTPTLNRLRREGTWYEQARAVLPAETLPTHAAMATGMLPQRSGIVANQIFRRQVPREYMQYPEFWEADTITTRLERAYAGGVSTATVLSKEYLYGLFLGEYDGPGDPLPQRQADFHWDPRTATGSYIPNPSAHAMDPATMNAFLGWISQNPSLPHFALVNLGDVDRAGHADESGVLFAGEADEDFPEQLTAADVSAFRQAAIEDTDAQIARLVTQLENMGAWDETVLIVLSDHGMDWGPQDKFPPIVPELRNAGYTMGDNPAASDFTVVGGGGSELIYVHQEDNVADIAERVSRVPGVEYVATAERVPGITDAKRNPTRRELGIEHPYSPAVEAFTETGYHSDPNGPGTNPLPGNHGNSVTQHSALLVAGGHPALRDTPQSLDGPDVFDRERKRLYVDPAGGPGVVSIAPTVAALFGIGEPVGGYDGAPLTDAFDRWVFAPAAGSGGGTGGTASTGGVARPLAGQSLTVGTTIASTPRRVRYGQRFTISGHVTGGPGCAGPLRVSLYRGDPARASAARVLATSITPRSDGRWSQSVRAAGTSSYFARVQPTRSCDGSVSPAIRVPARARVNVAPRCGSRGSANGRVLPAARGTRVVLERLVGRRYRRVFSARLDRSSRFRLPLRSCRGRYRVVWPAQRGLALTGSSAFTVRGARR